VDYSAANTGLWNFFINMGILTGALLVSNVLLRKSAIIRKTLMPTAVLAGFLLLALRSLGILNIPADFLEVVTYHGIAIGFIALSLRSTGEGDKTKGKGFQSGALIISTYMMQAVAGLIISITLSYTVMPGLFKASGILLPMGYGQGAGQANNVGSTYEALGFAGGQSFGLSLAAAGYLCACVVGVIYLNVRSRKGLKVGRDADLLSGSVTVDTFEDKGEAPLSESVDRLSIQVALVFLAYLLTYLVTLGLTKAIGAASQSLGDLLSPLLWGFNFITGSMLALLIRVIIKALRKSKVMTRQYQNNYLLSRISGLAFDLMIVSGISSINFSELSGLWVPFLLMAVTGGVTTFYFLRWLCRVVYPGYAEEAFVSMYGMLTGTISSGVILLRQLDPAFKTPAANNLITGSSFGIILGAPLLILIGLAAKSAAMLFLTLGLAAVYMVVLILVLYKGSKKK
jgi:ESS family glutamate:Na+ symporter